MSEQPPQSVEQVEELLSRPSSQAVEAMGQVDGDLVILGAGGKMGPTLARMARRASEAAGRRREIFAVSRFSDPRVRQRLAAWGVTPLPCDLLDETAVARLPDAPNVIHMTGFKFGASGAADLTWAVNCYAPALAARRYAASRFVAFSTGNVYPMVPPSSGGSKETDPPQPVGEYAMSALGRERIVEYFSKRRGMPAAILRLNYATELRYGVLVDLALDVLHERPIRLDMGYVNVIWLGDANAMTLAALRHAASPANVINVAGAQILRVRDVARRLGELLGKSVRFEGEEAATALLNNGERGRRLLGAERVSADQLIRWTADWVARGRPLLNKPTHFQVRNGVF